MLLWERCQSCHTVNDVYIDVYMAMLCVIYKNIRLCNKHFAAFLIYNLRMWEKAKSWSEEIPRSNVIALVGKGVGCSAWLIQIGLSGDERQAVRFGDF